MRSKNTQLSPCRVLPAGPLSGAADCSVSREQPMLTEVQAASAATSAGKQLERHRTMLLIRLFEEAVLTLNRAGLVAGTAHHA